MLPYYTSLYHELNHHAKLTRTQAGYQINPALFLSSFDSSHVPASINYHMQSSIAH